MMCFLFRAMHGVRGVCAGGSTIFLKPGSSVSVEKLLKGVIVQSGNDACIVLAENISGSEDAFAREMNAKAKSIGLTGSILSTQRLARRWSRDATRFGRIVTAYHLYIP